MDWQQKEYTVSSGIHALKWVYEDNGGDDGDNCGWVDYVQWSGPSPELDDWQKIEYKHDLAGRRSEKKVDGFSTRYLYDGPQVIAEYDGNNNLLRKYIYGPGIDQPACMIEVADSNATYYYHYDGLGSVVALSDSAGDTVQTYEYSVFGQPAAEYVDFTNPYMFAGRRYDIEIGQYYNRARCYNPYTGRFQQADPAAAGMNLYAYCGNNPIGFVDPSGKTSLSVGELAIYGGYWANRLPCPRYPGRWTSWVDFFGWYAHGEGQTINLVNIGLQGYLQRHEKITNWLDKHRNEYNKKAFNLAENLLKQGDVLFATKTYSGGEIPIDFGGSMNEVLYKVVKGLIDPPNSNPLVVLGNCTIRVNITISAWLNLSRSTATWICDIKFSLRDWFRDPGDIMDSYPGEIEWMDCTPYKIIADFSIVDIGTVLYWDPPSQAEEE